MPGPEQTCKGWPPLGTVASSVRRAIRGAGNSGGGGGPTTWEYASLALAESSGDPWQDGDDIQITAGTLFRYRSAAAAVDGYSGLVPKFPYDGTGVLGTLGALSSVISTAQGSDPDTWTGSWQDLSGGTKGIAYDFDILSSRSRIIRISNDASSATVLRDPAGGLTATDLETFMVIDAIKHNFTGNPSNPATIGQVSVIAAYDASNVRYVLLRREWLDTVWKVVHGSGTSASTQSCTTESRVYIHVKDGAWAVWFGGASPTPALSGTVPVSAVATPSYKLQLYAETMNSITNSALTLNQLVSGTMVTA